jgi:glycosyltransferase involved in cell wall biosynthesis
MGKRIYILAPYPPDEAPSQRFRFEQYLEQLKSRGHHIEFHPFLNRATWKALYLEGNFFQKSTGILGSFIRRSILLFSLRKADVVFIHREASMIGPPMFEWIIAKVLRKPFIYDFDDAIWLPNYSENNARFHRLKNYGKVRKIMRWAGKISAGNAYLKHFAQQYNSRVDVLPTTINMEKVHNTPSAHDQNPPNIVWTGSHTTMAYLQEFLPILQELEQEFDFVFTVISNQSPELNLRSFRFVRWSRESEIAELAKGSIGIMPMPRNEWSEGKCGFKGLQYMALGIPSLMSPVGVNTEIVDHGVNGFLCDSPEEWKTYIVRLLQDPELRKTMGKKGMETVRTRYSTEAQLSHYLRLFEEDSSKTESPH